MEIGVELGKVLRFADTETVSAIGTPDCGEVVVGNLHGRGVQPDIAKLVQLRAVGSIVNEHHTTATATPQLLNRRR